MELPINFRTVIRARFQNLQRANARYSGRAFARDLNVSHGLIAQILADKGPPLSRKLAETIVPLLKLSPIEHKRFLLFVEYEHVTDELKDVILSQVKKLDEQPLSEEIFSPEDLDFFYDFDVITTYVALDLKHPGGERDVARMTGVPFARTLEILLRLESLRFAKKTEHGNWTRSDRRPMLTPGQTSEALLRLNQQMLDSARKSLETQTLDTRYSGTETLALDEKSYIAARKVLDDALNQVAALGLQTSDPDRIYHLNVQFFQVGRTPNATSS